MLNTGIFSKATNNSNSIIGTIYLNCLSNASNAKCGHHFNVFKYKYIIVEIKKKNIIGFIRRSAGANIS